MNGEAPVARAVTVANERGLHARAAAKFVRVAERFDAQVTVTKGDTSVAGRSIMGLMMLAAGPGAELILTATGHDAAASVAALAQLVESGFDER